MPVNITIIGDDPNYLTDPAITLGASLLELGHDVVLSQNHISPDDRNIVLGCHNLSEDAGKALKDKGISWVGWQLEQLHSGNERRPEVGCLKYADAVYDYDPRNLAELKIRGIDAEMMPIGYHPALRPSTEAEKTVDVFMAGCMRARRQSIINSLKCDVHFARPLDPVFGMDLVEAVARAKICLNIHHSSPWDPQEQARITPLLAQGACVVSETSPHNIYGDGIIEAPFIELVDVVTELLRDEDRMREQRAMGLEAVKKIDMKQIVAGGISAYCSG